MDQLPPNPYAAPAASTLADSKARPPGVLVTWTYAALLGGGLGVFLAKQLGVVHGASNSAMHFAAILAIAATPFVGAVWLYKAWLSVADGPDETIEGVSPWGAIGRCFIPFYGIYWFFRAPLMLRRNIDRLRSDHGLGECAPRIAGMVAPIGLVASRLNSIVGGLNIVMVGVFVVGAVAWLVFMLGCDAARRDLASVANVASWWGRV